MIKTIEPEVINPKILDDQLYELKEQENGLSVELAAKKVELCKVLKECAEFKYGKEQKRNVDLMQVNATMDEVKTKSVTFSFLKTCFLITISLISNFQCDFLMFHRLLNDLINENLHNTSNFIDKAIEEMGHHIDGQIAKSVGVSEKQK